MNELIIHKIQNWKSISGHFDVIEIKSAVEMCFSFGFDSQQM